MRAVLLFAITLIALGFTACGGSGDDAPSFDTAITGKLKPKGEKLNVVVSIAPIASITMAIAGDHADVVLLMSVGTDPHEFQPTMRERRKLEDADLLIVNGLGMEIFDAQELAQASEIKLLDVGAKLPEEILISSGDDHAGHDHSGHDHAGHDHGDHDHDHWPINPHVWLSAKGASAQAEVIAETLASADPANAKAYRASAQALRAELEAIAQSGAAGLTAFAGTSIASEHDAFPYLAQEANLWTIPLMRIPSEGISVARRKEIEKRMRSANVSAIFLEPGAFNAAAAQAVAESLGLRSGTLDPLVLHEPTPALIVQGLRDNYAALGRTLKGE